MTSHTHTKKKKNECNKTKMTKFKFSVKTLIGRFAKFSKRINKQI